MAGPIAQGLLVAAEQRKNLGNGLLSRLAENPAVQGMSLSPYNRQRGWQIPPLVESAMRGAWSGLSYPGDVMRGEAPPDDYGRALDAAGLLTLGAGAMSAPENSLRMGAARFSTANDVERFAKSLGVDLSLSDGTKHITVNKIVVPKNARGQGIGSQIMSAVSEYADAAQKTVALTPSTDFGGSSKKRLAEFYKRFGFKENKGKSRDFSISEEMFRESLKRSEMEMEKQRFDAAFKAGNAI